MKIKNKSFNYTMLSALMIGSLCATPVVVNAQQTGSILIHYTNDSAKTQPISNSVWRLYKIADIETIVDEEGVDAYKFHSLISGLSITSDTTPDDVMEYFTYRYLNESRLTIEDESIAGDDLSYAESTSDSEGKILFDDLTYGVYLGVEMSAADNHLLSEPFLVSVANSLDGETSDIDLTIEPKAVLGGDLIIKKELSGNNTESDRKFSIQLSLPEGNYSYSLSNGESGTVKTGDILRIKGGEEINIQDIVSGGHYTIQELEANKDGYKTTYDNQSGDITYNNNTVATVTNQRDKEEYWIKGTFDKWMTSLQENDNNSSFWVAIGGFMLIAFAALSYLLIAIKQHKEVSNNEE